MWGFKKHGKQSIGKTKGGWNTKLHMVSADDKIAVNLSLSAGNEHDVPEGRKLLSSTKNSMPGTAILMDKAYEDNETRDLAEKLGYVPQLFLLKSIERSRGNMTKRCTKTEMLLKDFSED